MEEHEAMLAQLEQRVRRVLEMLDQLREQNVDLRQQIADLKQEGAELRNTIESQNSRIEGLLYLEGEVAELRQQKADVRDQLAHIIQVLDSATGIDDSVPSRAEPEAERTGLDTAQVAEEEILTDTGVGDEEEGEDETDVVSEESEDESDRLQQREPLTPDEIAELGAEDDEDADLIAEDILPSEDADPQAVPTAEVDTEEVIDVDEPELAGIFDLRDLEDSVEFTDEEENALALIYQHDELEESQLESLLENEGFTGIRVKNLIDQIIEKGMRLDQNLLQMRFEKGRFYYRRHPDAAPLP